MSDMSGKQKLSLFAENETIRDGIVFHSLKSEIVTLAKCVEHRHI